MQELINKLMAEVGLSSEQASTALNTVVSHVKGMLPSPIADKLDHFMGGGTEAAASAEPMAASATTEENSGGIMDKAGDMADAAKEKLEDLADVAKEKLGGIVGAENLESLENLKDKAGDLAEGAINKLKGLFGG